jgi:hypothetical protein
VRFLSRAVYAAFAVFGIGLGLLVVVDPARALSPGEVSPVAAHLVREQGSEAVFIGLMAVWCMRHYEQRRPVHLALLAFAALFSLAHWIEYAQGRRGLASPLVNSVPLAALLATMPRAARMSEAKSG